MAAAKKPTAVEFLKSLQPAAEEAACAALRAMAEGKPALAARRAEEAAQRQATALAVDATLRGAAKLKKGK